MATVSPHGVQLHRIPAALLRARSQATDGTPVDGWAATVVRLLEKAAPGGDLRMDLAGRPAWKRLLPHVLAAAGHDDALDRGSGRGHPTPRSRRGLPARRWRGPGRLAVYERAYEVRRDKFGDDHPDTLTSASDLALNLWRLGEYQRARALDEDTLTRRRRILGDDHPDTLTSASQLANDLFGLGNYPQARKLQEDDADAGAAVSSATTTPTPSSRPTSSAWSCGRWVTISRPGSSRTTPCTRSAESSATTTPTPSPRPASSAWSCGRWVTIGGPGSS